MEEVYFKPTDEYLEKANKVFERQKERILLLLPNVDIQHVGSTAVPGSITKGDLDINVRVLASDFQKAVKALKSLYEINQPDNWTEEFASFKDDKNLGIDFGTQLTAIGSKTDYFVAARDALLNNSQLVVEYNKMKQQFDGKDMDDYRKAKSAFFQKLIQS